MSMSKKGIYQENSLFGYKFEKQSYELAADRNWQAGKVELIYIDISGCPKTTTRPLVFFYGHLGGNVRVKFYLGK